MTVTNFFAMSSGLRDNARYTLKNAKIHKYSNMQILKTFADSQKSP